MYLVGLYIYIYITRCYTVRTISSYITNFCQNTVPEYCNRWKISWRCWQWIFYTKILCLILIHIGMSKQQNRILSRPLTFGLAPACGRLWQWRVQCPSAMIKPATEVVPLMRKGSKKRKIESYKIKNLLDISLRSHSPFLWTGIAGLISSFV